MDNNASEREVRGPAVARKNFYGSGSLWSGRLAAMMFSLFATLVRWKLNPRRWLTWYFESCAAAGGKAPEDIQPFLPWNLSDARRSALGVPDTAPCAGQHLLTLLVTPAASPQIQDFFPLCPLNGADSPLGESLR